MSEPTKHPLRPSADRGHLATEQSNASSMQLDTLSIEQTLTLINDEDARVHVAVRQAIPALTRLVDAIVKAFRGGGRLVYLGAGTSGRLGVLDASECPPTYFTDPSMVVGIIAGGDVALRRAVEGAEDDPDGAKAELERLNVGADDVVVGIAAGGTTPYVLGALRIAKSRGCVTGFITCVPLSAIEQRPQAARLNEYVDHPIELLTGPEVVTGSTRMKAGTATKLALNMITTAAMVQIGKTWGNLMVDLRATNAKLVDRAARIVSTQTGVSRDEALRLLDRAAGRAKLALVMAKRGVDAAEAQRLLDRAAGRAKLALVMAKRGIDAAEAQRLLDQTAGQLRPLLGSPR
jgi:N-acetylmuramic acid 6-phosphate etherase